MTAIVSDEYRAEQAELAADPIIYAMMRGLVDVPMDQLVHPGSTTPRHEFMGAANAEYAKRGGTRSRTIGGVATALLTVLADYRASR